MHIKLGLSHRVYPFPEIAIHIQLDSNKLAVFQTKSVKKPLLCINGYEI